VWLCAAVEEAASDQAAFNQAAFNQAALKWGVRKEVGGGYEHLVVCSR
jgi:hypothetical protein